MNQTRKYSPSSKFLALILALIMLIGVLPVNSFAEEQQTENGADIQNAVLENEVEPGTAAQENAADVPAASYEDSGTDAAVQAMDGASPLAATGMNDIVKTKSVPLQDGTFYRIVHIDCGRKYFSEENLKTIIDYAAENAYTHVELAFGNDGLRFLLDDMSLAGYDFTGSRVSAAIQAGNQSFYNQGTNELTQSEMDRILAYAKTKRVGIIPMFDAPGHLQTVVRAMQTLGLSPKYSTPTTSGTSVNWSIDPTDAVGVNFVQALMQKYITYFAGKGCTMFNIAADECGFTSMSTDTYTAYAEFVNRLAAMVQNTGMTALAFNDGIYHIGKYLEDGVEFDTNIAICYWDASSDKYAPAATLAGKGFKIINTNNKWYYVIGKENITGNNWSQYAYTCEYAKQQMSSEGSCLNIDGDNYKTTPAGCMAAIWCDYPGNSVNWSNVESYISTLAAYNSAYFVKAAVPEITGGGVINLGDTATYSLSNGASAEWSVEPADVLQITSATRAGTTGTSVTVMALKAGEGTITAVTDDAEYTFSVTVRDPDEVIYEERTITLTVGGTAEDTITGENYAGSYVTEDPSVATVSVTGKDAVEATVRYTKTSTTYRSLGAGNSTSWTKTSYYYTPDNGANYYPVYTRVQWNYYNTTYCYGYSATDSDSSVTQIDSSTNYRGTISDVYTKTGTEGSPASTTVIFNGRKIGTTYATIGNVKYTIRVVAEDLTNAAKLPIQLWITNIPIEVDTNAYSGGSTSGSFRTNNSWSEQKAWYVALSAADAYGEEGVPLSQVLPGVMPRYEHNITYWIAKQTNKKEMNLALWSGRVHTKTSGDIQKVWDKDYSNSGDEFQYVRYYGGKWEVSADRQSWSEVTGAGSTTSYSSCTQQLAAYYMIRSEITKEVTTDVADWGFVSSDADYSNQIGTGNYVMLDFAVKYQGGTRNPNSFPQQDKTFVFHCNTGDTSGAVKQDSSSNYYRQLNNFRAVNSSDYEVYMVTVTMTEDAAADTLSSTTSYEYNGEEQIVWAIDEETRDVSGLNPYTAITTGDTTYSGCSIGGDPYVRGIEVYNKHGALVTYYIRAKVTEDSLQVHYINKLTGHEFYNYPITVTEGTVFDESFAQVEPNTTKLTGNTVVNSLGVTQTVTAQLENIPAIGAQYRYGNYTCVEVRRDDETGKHVYLYYMFNATKTFVVDFGLPLTIQPTDVAPTLANANITNVAVHNSQYAAVKKGDNFSIIYTLNKMIDGQDDITVTYYGKNAVSEELGEATYTVSMIPASNVYYEDSFATFTDGSGKAADAVWTVVDNSDAAAEDSSAMQQQALEELGDKKDLYGYDSAYDGTAKLSMNSAHKVTVSSDMADSWDEATSTWPAASFSFKGTGFDIVSLTNNTSGAIFVDVAKKDGTIAKKLVVNNYYGYKQEQGEDGKTVWVVDTQSNNTLYQIPVIKVSDLEYGEYSVTVRVAYSPYFDQTNPSGSYSFWMDAIRIYDPMGKDASIYEQDGEGYPQYIKLRNALAKDKTANAEVVFIDGGNTADIATYANYGPNNEVYLAGGQAISFKVPDNDQIVSVQLGAKAPNGVAKLSVAGAVLADGSSTAVDKEINTATEMYYELRTTSADRIVTITNNGTGVLSLTNLKFTFSTVQADFSLNALNADDQSRAVMAVRALFAAPAEPESFEPEVFQAAWKRGTVRAGQKATLTITTSEDVAAVAVNGQEITTYRTRTQRIGRGFSAQKVTYREFTYSVTAVETADYIVTAISAEGAVSQPFTMTLTVQGSSGSGNWIQNIINRWF